MRFEENPAAGNLSGRGAEQTLASAWDRLVELLPADWSHLLIELDLQPDESYHRVALIVSPLNPARCDGRSALRFRVARDFGYGAAPEMVERSLQRLDESEITGRLSLLELLAESRPIETQGPVWRLRGRSL